LLNRQTAKDKHYEVLPLRIGHRGIRDQFRPPFVFYRYIGMRNVDVLDKPILTPTLRALRATRQRRQSGLFIYAPLPVVVRAATLGADAVLLYLILVSLQRVSSGDFFAVRAEFEDAVGRGRRWWYRHALTLEQAGLIEVLRRPGAGARYRLTGDTKSKFTSTAKSAGSEKT
jgi:hypothetical protein